MSKNYPKNPHQQQTRVNEPGDDIIFEAPAAPPVLARVGEVAPNPHSLLRESDGCACGCTCATPRALVIAALVTGITSRITPSFDGLARTVQSYLDALEKAGLV